MPTTGSDTDCTEEADRPHRARREITDPDALIKVGAFALVLLGTDDEGACKTVARMADRGEIASIRIGPRGDRFILRSEADRIRALAESNRRTSA